MFRYVMSLALKNMRSRTVQSALTAVIVALAVALMVVVIVLNDGVQQGVIEASEAFGVLVLGPKGSAQQLVVSTILLQDVPVGLVDQSAYARYVQDDPRFVVVPIAMSDNIGGAPIIGTDANFFKLRRSTNAPPLFALAGGRTFTADFEAVLGAEAANATGLTIGAQFHSAHGIGAGLASDVHTTVTYTVVGVLRRTGTPYDRAVFATTNSIWQTHEMSNELTALRFQAPDLKAAPDNPAQPVIARGKLTAAFVLPYGVPLGDLYRLSQQINNSPYVQAAFPGAQLGALFNLLNQGGLVLNGVAWLALIMAGLTILLSLYGTTLARRQGIAIMRSLGASRRVIFATVVCEAVLLTAFGVVLGATLGHVVAAGIAGAITGSSAIPVTVRFIASAELPMLLIPLLLGPLAGLIPAALAYRVDAVEHLFAT